MNERGDANVKPGRQDDAPWDAVNELFFGMASCLWDEHSQRWDARARGCPEYAHAKTPAAAMRAALDLKEQKAPAAGAASPPAPTPRPRRIVDLEEPAPLFTARRRLS